MFLQVKANQHHFKTSQLCKVFVALWQRISLTQFLYVGNHHVALFHVGSSKAIDGEQD